MNWKKLTENGKLPEPRTSFGMVAHKGRIIVFGGLIGKDKQDNEVFVYDLNKQEWEHVKTTGEKPKARSVFVSELFENKMIIFGGIGEMLPEYECFNDVWQLDLETFEWEELKITGKIPTPRFAHSSAILDNKMYIFGGYEINYEEFGPPLLNEIWELDLKEKKWIEINAQGELPSSRFSPVTTACYVPDDQGNMRPMLFCYGGGGGFSGLETTYNEFHIFDISTSTWELVELSTQTPPLRAGTLLPFFSKDKVLSLLLFGGVNELGNAGWVVNNDLWLIDPFKKTAFLVDDDEVDFDKTVSPRYSHKSVLVDNHMVVFGGWDGQWNGFQNDMFMVDVNSLLELKEKEKDEKEKDEK
ncbi:hypothetical protein M0811_11960 [Anaeramoeba ignava]|uniref:Kelch repeat-containing protein n=1 Tax=Anaeramoeba ignava TaxID=1746090 RepID=A0A9Q0LBT9_ANAIG|nr:hypothetical protein M0811_11960 [Anaeramoeba ignava]